MMLAGGVMELGGAGLVALDVIPDGTAVAGVPLAAAGLAVVTEGAQLTRKTFTSIPVQNTEVQYSFANDYESQTSNQSIADANKGSGKPASQTTRSVQGKGTFKGSTFRVDAEPYSDENMIHIQNSANKIDKTSLDMKVSEIDYKGTSTDKKILQDLQEQLGKNVTKTMNQQDLDAMVKGVKKAAELSRTGTPYAQWERK